MERRIEGGREGRGGEGGEERRRDGCMREKERLIQSMHKVRL